MNKPQRKLNRGMTYVELIVVLGIFSLMSAVVIYNYRGFQTNVDIRNLASDIASQIAEAQNSALAGANPNLFGSNKPAYGVYFNINAQPTGDNKSFIYFADTDNLKNYNSDSITCSGECLNKITIAKSGYKISELMVFYTNNTSAAISKFSVSFIRPDSGAYLTSSDFNSTPISYVQIKVGTLDGSKTSTIKVYPSGRVQIN